MKNVHAIEHSILGVEAAASAIPVPDLVRFWFHRRVDDLLGAAAAKGDLSGDMELRVELRPASRQCGECGFTIRPRDGRCLRCHPEFLPVTAAPPPSVKGRVETTATMTAAFARKHFGLKIEDDDAIVEVTIRPGRR